MAKNTTTKAIADGSEKSLNTALSALEKQFGKGIIMRGNERVGLDVETFPTGSMGLDRALGVGGYPVGRIIEIFGPEGSGKTTLTLHAIAEIQKRGGTAAFIDAEHALDPKYATAIGVDMGKLLISQPDCGEDALEIAETLVLSGAVKIVVIDSVAALVPRAEINGEMGDSHVGLQARLMSQALRKLAGATYKTGTTVFFINQLRMKIGVMFGNPETTTGGNALKFYSSVRLDVRRTSQIKEGENIVGSTHRVKVIKNKVAPPFRQCEFDMRGTGVEFEAELIDHGVEHGLVEKSGAWYSMDGERIGQGRANAIQYIKDHPALRESLTAQLRSIYERTGASTTATGTSEVIDEETGEVISV